MSSSSINPPPLDPLIGKVLKSATGTEYEIVSPIASGSNGDAFIATSNDSKQVAIKRLNLKGLNSWKQLELFEREAKVLASLSHPSIPKYVDYFESDEGFFLVQELVKGLDLATMIGKGMRATDEQATRIAIELITICNYLASLRPPVVHRDIKPANIVLEGGSWDGKAYLIDFGGVLATSMESNDQNTLTFVGTFGYLSPEQFRNQAVPASDLYSVGATLLFLLSGRDPSSIPQERMRLKWRDVLSLPRSEKKWPLVLDGLLEPLVEDRMSGSEALAVLQGQEVPKPSLSSFAKKRRSKGLSRVDDEMSRRGLIASGSAPKPQGTRVILERSTNRLDFCIPAKGLGMDTAFTGAFAIAWNSFVAIWTVGALSSGGILFALFSLPFWLAGAQLGKQAVVGALMRERFAIGPNKFRLGQELALLDGSGTRASFGEGSALNEKVAEGSTSDLRGAKVATTMVVNDSPQTAIEVLEGVNKYRFGEGLELSEQLWIVSEINSFLEESRGSKLDVGSFPVNEGGPLGLVESDAFYASGALTPLLFMDGTYLKNEDENSSEGINSTGSDDVGGSFSDGGSGGNDSDA